jgi:beta-glucosidase
VARPPRELASFASVALEAGERRIVELPVRREDLAHWDVRTGAWVVEGGPYAVEVGASSRDLRLAVTVSIVGDEVRLPLSLDSTVQEVMADEEAADIIRPGLSRFLEDPEMLTLLGSAPVGRILGFPGTGVVPADVGRQLERLNAERGLG